MDIPLLGEAIALANLAGVAIAIRAVLTFDERRVDVSAYQRGLQGRLHIRRASEDHARFHLHDTALLPRLMHRGITQVSPAPPNEDRLGDPGGRFAEA